MSLDNAIVGQLRVGNVSALEKKFTCEAQPLSTRTKPVRSGDSAAEEFFGRPIREETIITIRTLEKRCSTRLPEDQRLDFYFQAQEIHSPDWELHWHGARAEFRWGSRLQINGTTVELAVKDDNADGALQSQGDTIRLRWPESHVHRDGSIGREVWFAYTDRGWKLLGSHGSTDRRANERELLTVIRPVEAAFQGALSTLNLAPAGTIGCGLTRP